MGKQQLNNINTNRRMTCN